MNLKYELEITKKGLEKIKEYFEKTEVFDLKNMTEEQIIKNLFWIPEVDENFEIRDQIKITRIN